MLKAFASMYSIPRAWVGMPPPGIWSRRGVIEIVADQFDLDDLNFGTLIGFRFN